MIYLTREYYCIGVGLIGTSLSHLPAIHYIYYQLSTTYQLHTYNSLHIYLLPTTYCLLLPSATYYLLPITATCHLLPAAYYIPTIYNLQPSSHMTAQHKRKPCHHAFRPIVRLYGLYIHLLLYVLRIAAPENFLPLDTYGIATFLPHLIVLFFFLCLDQKLLHARRRLLPFVNHSLVHILVFVHFSLRQLPPALLALSTRVQHLHPPPTAYLF